MKYLFTFLALVVLSFQLMAQKTYLELVVSPDNVEVGEQVTITVKSDIGGNFDIQLPSELEQGYSVVKGMKQEMDYTSGRFISLYYLSKDGVFSKPGKYIIGPASIRKGGKLFKSNTVSVTVSKASNSNNLAKQPSVNIQKKNSSQPAFGIVDLSKKKVYEGEALIAKSFVYARFRPTHLENYQTYEMLDIMDAHSLDKGTQINLEEKNINGESMFTFSMDSKLVFPIKKGIHTIMPFQIELKSGFRGFTFKSNPVSYEVIPLPKKAPSSFKGGVGEFSVSRYIDAEKYKQGDVVQLVFEVKGKGNLHLLQEPSLNLPKSIQVYGDPVIKEDYHFGRGGVEGFIKYTYNIQLLDSGKVMIPEMDYSFFNVSKEEYITLKNGSIQLEIEGDPNFALITDLYKSDSTLIEIGDEVLTEVESNSNKQAKGFNYIFASLLVFLVLIIIVLLLVLFKKKRLNDTQHIKEEVDMPKESVKNNVDFNLTTNLDSIRELYNDNENEEFYKLIQKTIIYSLKDKLGIDRNTFISNADLLTMLRTKQTDQSYIDEISFLLEKTESARYGMVLLESEKDEFYSRFQNFFSNITRG
jgi:hypothetical protein